MTDDDPLMLTAEPYRSQLDPDQLAKGMTAANHNAARLLDDAGSLFAMRRWASAAALAILAIEETAKEEILRALATWPAESKVFWRAFSSHKDKGDLAIIAFAELPTSESTGSLASLIALLALLFVVNSRVIGEAIEHTKWRALYVDCLSDAGRPRWWSPESFGMAEAQAMLEAAHRVVNRRVISSEEVRALIKHVAPVAGKPIAELNRAQGRYLREVVERGLRPEEPWMHSRLGFDPWDDATDHGIVT